MVLELMTKLNNLCVYIIIYKGILVDDFWYLFINEATACATVGTRENHCLKDAFMLFQLVWG